MATDTVHRQTRATDRSPGTARARRVRRPAMLTALTAGLIAWLLAGAVAAFAIPPSGAGSDTPGTSSSVSPGTVAPGGTLNFTVQGFPAGETLSIKIDDGVGYGDTSLQGSGVIHTQVIPGSGTVNGSIQLPADITAGAHWLRFLASEEVDVQGGGTLGYTNRSPDFTVAVSGTGGSGSSGSGGSGAAGGAGAEADAGAGAAAESTEGAVGSGEVLEIDPDAVGEAEGEAAESEEATSADAEPASADAATSDDEGGFPVLGVVGAAVLVLVGGGVTLLILRSGSRPTQG